MMTHNDVSLSVDKHYLWLFFPHKQSLKKVMWLLQQQRYATKLQANLCLTVELPSIPTLTFWQPLVAVISSIEANNLNVLCLSHPGMPDLVSLSQIETLTHLITRLQQRERQQAMADPSPMVAFSPIKALTAKQVLYKPLGHELVTKTLSVQSLALAKQLRPTTQLFVPFTLPQKTMIEQSLQQTLGLVAQSGWQPHHLVLQLQLTRGQVDAAGLSDFAQQFRAAGFSFALNGIGSCWSGLNSLRLLQPQFIKYEQALIADIAHESFKQRLVKHVSQLCHSLGMASIATDVSNTEDLVWLAAQGVDYWQPPAKTLVGAKQVTQHAV